MLMLHNSLFQFIPSKCPYKYYILKLAKPKFRGQVITTGTLCVKSGKESLRWFWREGKKLYHVQTFMYIKLCNYISSCSWNFKSAAPSSLRQTSLQLGSNNVLFHMQLKHLNWLQKAWKSRVLLY